MSTAKIDIVTQFLMKHNYIVKCIVVKDDDGHISVNCKYADVFERNYKIRHVKDNFYDIDVAYNDCEESILMPSYTVRWYLFLDILRLCRNNKLSYNIIRSFDVEENNKDLLELVDIEISENDQNLESEIAAAISSTLKDSTTINKFDEEYLKMGILHNFNILKGLLV